MTERLISQETTRKAEIGGALAWLTGILLKMPLLPEVGAIVGGGALIYDVYEYTKNKKK